ncbi:hypothetical protein D3C75_792830 [compost metagenome]
MNLNLIHIDCDAAELLDHFDAVTGAANLVGSYQPFQIRSNLGNHFFIGTKPAGCHNDRRSRYCFFICLVEQDFDAVYFTVFFGNFLDIRVHEKWNALFLYVFHQALDKVLPYCGAVFRTVCAFFLHAAGNGDVVQTDSDGIQPVDCT